MTDILSKIDAAVESRCACGCGRELAADGNSMWYVTEACQGCHTQQRSGFFEGCQQTWHTLHGDLIALARAESPLQAARRAAAEGRGTFTRIAGQVGPDEHLHPDRIWINDREVTEFVRSVQLSPSPFVTSLSLGEEVNRAMAQAYWPLEPHTFTGPVAGDDETDPYSTVTRYGQEDWRDRAREASDRIDDVWRASAWISEHMSPPTPRQREMLEHAYEDALYGSRPLVLASSAPPRSFEIPLEPLSGTHRQFLVVNPGWLHERVYRSGVPVSALTAVYDFIQNRYRIQCHAGMVVEVAAEQLEAAGAMLRQVVPDRAPWACEVCGRTSLHWADNCIRPQRQPRVPRWRPRVTPRSYTPPRANPYITQLRRAYRQRQLARRRRNR